MRRYVVLLLITGIVWAQTDYDTLVLIDKTVYTGRLVKYDNDEIKFKVSLPTGTLPSTVSLSSSRIFTAKLSININDIQELILSDGTKAFENGTSVDLKKLRRYIEMVKLEQSRNDAIVCCSLIIILGLTAFFTSDFDLGWPAGPWPGDGATMDG